MNPSPGDTITLNGAVVGDIAGEAGGDIIDIITGTASTVYGDFIGLAGGTPGADTITQSGGQVPRIEGGDDNDIITISGGLVTGTVSGGNDNDTISASGNATTGALRGENGNDLINISGSALVSSIVGNNNDRVTQVLASGRFGPMQFGKIPVAGYEGMVFVFYKLKSGNAQIGFGARATGEQYCIAVEGTPSGKELYIAGP